MSIYITNRTYIICGYVPLSMMSIIKITTSSAVQNHQLADQKSISDRLSSETLYRIPVYIGQWIGRTVRSFKDVSVYASVNNTHKHIKQTTTVTAPLNYKKMLKLDLFTIICMILKHLLMFKCSW